jgi:tRNA-2-methylthio-N6-dimethylallyladenosine synthase
MGYSEAQTPDEADVILINTCTVRGSAENKALGYIASLKRVKGQGTGSKKIIGVCGCLAQQEKEALPKKYPFVDFVLGPGSLHELGSVIESRLAPRASHLDPFIETCDPLLRNLPQKRKPSTVAYVSIMYGCDNFCSYCIVPFVRGREVSRPKEDILNEIEGLDKSVFKEVVLLGQNVNSYKHQAPSAKTQAGLAQLLVDVSTVKGIERIRFLTSHPRDMSDDIIQAVKELPKVCEYFHLPIQSGDDEILKVMNRGYTLHYYKGMVERIRKAIPGAAITSDAVVGFPGETDRQFGNTLKAIKDIGFDLVNTFAYSDRAGTAASKMKDKVPEDVKDERLHELMRVVEDTASKKNQELVGKVVEILVDEPNIGRTRTNKVVKFERDDSLVGKLVNVKIKKAKSWVLEGELSGLMS